MRGPLPLWGRYLYGGEAFRVDQTSELVRRGRIIAAEQLRAAEYGVPSGNNSICCIVSPFHIVFGSKMDFSTK